MRALLLLAGCGGLFVEARPGAVSATGVSVSFCGATKLTLDNVVKTIEPPSDLPPEVGGSGGLEPPEEARFCLQVDNRGAQAAHIDRSYLTLKCPRERQSWVPDPDAQEVQVRPGEARQIHVTFHYSPLDAGEDVDVVLDAAFTVAGHKLKLAPLPLRRK